MGGDRDVLDPAGGCVGAAGDLDGFDGDEDVAVGGEALVVEGFRGEDADDDDAVEVALGAVDAGDGVVEQDLGARGEAGELEVGVGGGFD